MVLMTVHSRTISNPRSKTLHLHLLMCSWYVSLSKFGPSCTLQTITFISISHTRHCHTDRGISSLIRVLRKTEVLKLKRLHQITSKGLKSIVSRSLKDINLSESNGISDEGIIALVHNCPNIERLSVFELYKLSDVSLTQVAAVLGDTLVSPDLILVY